MQKECLERILEKTLRRRIATAHAPVVGSNGHIYDEMGSPNGDTNGEASTADAWADSAVRRHLYYMVYGVENTLHHHTSFQALDTHTRVLTSPMLQPLFFFLQLVIMSNHGRLLEDTMREVEAGYISALKCAWLVYAYRDPLTRGDYETYRCVNRLYFKFVI